MQSSKLQEGYIAILTVLIISVVVLAVATTVSLLSIGEAQSGLALFKGEDTLTFVESCMEDALLKARNNNSYTGGTITRPEGTCSITVSKAGTTWTVTATTTATQYVRTVQAVVTRGTAVTITSWKEI
jgi:hypothetical protein